MSKIDYKLCCLYNSEYGKCGSFLRDRVEKEGIVRTPPLPLGGGWAFFWHFSLGGAWKIFKGHVGVPHTGGGEFFAVGVQILVP